MCGDRLYSVAVVLITYEMSRRIANTAWLQLVVSGLIVVGISLVSFDAVGGDCCPAGPQNFVAVRGGRPFVKMWLTAGGRVHEEATARY